MLEQSNNGAESNTPPIGLSTSTDRSAGIITLDRPKALNALTDQMRAVLPPVLNSWAQDPMIYGSIIESTSPKAFSAGGDLREYCTVAKSNLDEAMRQTAVEYTLNWQFECHPKPMVSLIDGICMGSGVGLSVFNTHRVAGQGYRFAMPEVCAGFFPDVGATYFLARLPSEIGMYLALTGRAIGRDDAYRLGLATHCIDRERFDVIRAALANADTIDPVLDDLHEDPGGGEVMALEGTIQSVFSAPSVEETIKRLGQISGPERAWADQTADEMAKNSPTSLKVAHRQMRLGGDLDLEEALKLEYRLARHFLTAHDLYEGVRALLVDKDQRPAWQPATLADVSDEAVTLCFEPDDAAMDLELPTFHAGPGPIA